MPRKWRGIDIDAAASVRGSFDPHTNIDNLKPEIKLLQDLNQYSFELHHK
jgi:hypothetical protein